jgi:LmbE family N-acetylglucosaminyl deacetylase
MNKILVVSPHTDDGELGCGASISRFVREGKEVHYFALTSIVKTENGKADIINEARKSVVDVLGIKVENFYYASFDIREFYKDRQLILDWMLDLQKKNKYDLVLIPSLNDLHQDHIVVAQEGLRAFKHITILGYELPWNNIDIRSGCFISVCKKDVENKMMALQHYVSQVGRKYMSWEFISGWAIMRGVQINKEYAEMFEVIRWVI